MNSVGWKAGETKTSEVALREKGPGPLSKWHISLFQLLLLLLLLLVVVVVMVVNQEPQWCVCPEPFLRKPRDCAGSGISRSEPGAHESLMEDQRQCPSSHLLGGHH